MTRMPLPATQWQSHALGGRSGDGVVLYQGGYRAAAVRQHDGVVIIEAPESNAKARAVLADVAPRWSGARVKPVINTSPMWMHLGGLREYAARGIPIYVADAGASVVRDILAAPHRQAPDSLSRLRLTPTVRVVSRMTSDRSFAQRVASTCRR